MTAHQATVHQRSEAGCAHRMNKAPSAEAPTNSSAEGAWKNLWRILRGVLDEITDQRAYRAHLAAHGTVHSAAEWRNFCDEHYKAKGRRGSCC